MVMAIDTHRPHGRNAASLRHLLLQFKSVVSRKAPSQLMHWRLCNTVNPNTLRVAILKLLQILDRPACLNQLRSSTTSRGLLATCRKLSRYSSHKSILLTISLGTLATPVSASVVIPHQTPTSLQRQTPFTPYQHVMRQEENSASWNWLVTLLVAVLFFSLVSGLIYRRFSTSRQRAKKQRGKHAKVQSKRKGKSRRAEATDSGTSVAGTTAPSPSAIWSRVSVPIDQLSTQTVGIVLIFTKISSHSTNGAQTLSKIIGNCLQEVANSLTGSLVFPTEISLARVLPTRLPFWSTTGLSSSPEAIPLIFNTEFSEDDTTTSGDNSEEYDGDSETNKLDNVKDQEFQATIALKRKQSKSKAERRKAIQDQLTQSKLGGLENGGNTCFMNAVIQSLASLDSLDVFLQEIANSGKAPDSPSVVLSDLIHRINTKSLSNHAYSTTQLIESISKQSSRWLSASNQEDAQEYFQQVLTFLENDVKRTQKNMDKPRIMTPFDGETAIRVGCLKCGEMEGIRKEVMSSVGLSLTATTEHVDILDLLDEYSQLETISGVECYRCGLIAAERELADKISESKPCKDDPAKLAKIQEALKLPVIDEKFRPLTVKQLSDKSKQMMFARPTARVLAFHINRSVFDPTTGSVRKNLSPVSFPEQLDLSPYVVHDLKDPNNKRPQFAMTPERPRRKRFSESEDSDLSLDRSAIMSEVDFGTHVQEAEASLTESTMDNQWSQHSSPDTSVCTSPLLTPAISTLDMGFLGPLDSAPDDYMNSARHLPFPMTTAATLSDTTLLYKLKAVIVHYGTHHFGHYICYRRCRHKLWWQMSDRAVVQVDESTVLNAQGVFMLFYELAQESKNRAMWIKTAQKTAQVQDQQASNGSGDEVEGFGGVASADTIVLGDEMSPETPKLLVTSASPPGSAQHEGGANTGPKKRKRGGPKKPVKKRS